METLTVGFSKARSKWKFFSTLIRWIEGTTFSHVFIRWNSQYLERDVIYQASGSAVNFQEGKRFDSINETVYKFDILLSDSTRKKVVQFAMDQAGSPYSLKQLLGLLIAKVSKLLGFKPLNPLKDGRSSYICCELVAEILAELGHKMPQDLDDITPKDVFEFLNKRLGNTNG
jgi:hypothetical protein